MLNIQQDVLLAPFTTFNIGGPADYFVVVTTLDGLKEAVVWAQEKSMPYFLLGAGANILVGDKGYRGLVIKNEAKQFVIANAVKQSSLNEIASSHGPRNDTPILTAESGAVISDILQQTAKEGLSGFEDFAGIVSTVGGALWQNLHFLNSERTKTVYIADIVESAEILHEDGLQDVVDKAYFRFGYDESILHTKKDIVLSATFRLTKKDPLSIQKTIAANLLWRAQKHPKGAQHCSAGSVFKKIEGQGAGRLIEQVGLKGKQIGGAQISPIHANFIVNTGGATAKDVMDLIGLVQMRVKEQLGFVLEPEISFVGEL